MSSSSSIISISIIVGIVTIIVKAAESVGLEGPELEEARRLLAEERHNSSNNNTNNDKHDNTSHTANDNNDNQNDN